jgi:hypothetical protein
LASVRVSISPPIASPRSPTVTFGTGSPPSVTTPSTCTCREITMRISSDGTGT